MKFLQWNAIFIKEEAGRKNSHNYLWQWQEKSKTVNSTIEVTCVEEENYGIGF